MISKMVWNIDDLAAALGRTSSSIRVDLCRKNWNRVPHPTRLAGSLVFRPQDVEAWLEEKAKESGAWIETLPIEESEPPSRRGRGRPKKSKEIKNNSQG